MSGERRQTFDSGDRARALPSRAQLLLLVECAEQRELTSGEAHLLRVGVTHLASQLEAAGTKLRALEDERDARDDRDGVGAEFGSPLLVACGYCGAPVGRRCVSKTVGAPLATSHTARLHALRRRLEAAPSLTVEQMRLLGMVADGLTVEQIGRRLGVAPHAVRQRLVVLRRRLGVGTNPQLVHRAHVLGFLGLAAPEEFSAAGRVAS